jgi:glyoxylase I family protein
MKSIAEELLECEKRLLDPVLRRTPERLAALLADNFVEFASSGRTYDKKQVIYHLGRQLPAQVRIEEFRVVELAPGIALVTYRARAESADEKDERYSLRSALWVRRGGNWQMVFHQGTPISENGQLNRSSLPFTKKTAGV